MNFHSRFNYFFKRVRKVTPNRENVQHYISSVTPGPVKLWQLGVQGVFFVGRVSFTVPFVATPTSDGNCILKRGGQFRRSSAIFFQVVLVLRTIFLASIVTDEKFTWTTVNGLLNGDVAMYITVTTVTMLSVLTSLTLIVEQDEVIMLYNCFWKQNKIFSGKYFGTKNIMKEAQNSVVIYAVSIALYMCRLQLVFLAMVALGFQSSPLLLPYHVHKLALHFDGSEPLLETLHWTSLFMDWVILCAGGITNITTLIIVGEPLTGVPLILESQCSRMDMTWREMRSHHIEMELIMVLLNRVLARVFPTIIFAMLVLAVFGNTLLFSTHMRPSDCYPCTYLFIGTLAFVGIVIGSLLLRHGENIRARSVFVMTVIREQINTEGIPWAVAGSSKKSSGQCGQRLSGRIFMRHPLGIRLGHFMWVQEGFALAYLQRVLDNTISYILTTDVKTPMWLL